MNYPRALPTLKHAEIRRELDKLTDAQIDYLVEICPERFSSRSTGAEQYQTAIRLGWLMGPA